jgi:hypothetical protein
VTSLVRTASLAAAPLSVWQADRRATSRGATKVFGRRGSGTIDLVARTPWSGTHKNPARQMQRPSEAPVRHKGPSEHFFFLQLAVNNNTDIRY